MTETCWNNSPVKTSLRQMKKCLTPEMVKWWDLEKNIHIGTPAEQWATSKKLAWWKCDAGHEWNERIKSLYSRKNCQYCNRNLPSPEYNLATVNPELASEWHPSKNLNLKPTEVLSNTYKKVWWLCPCGHEWEDQIGRRNKLKVGCAHCRNNKIKKVTKPSSNLTLENNKSISTKTKISKTEVNLLAFTKRWG